MHLSARVWGSLSRRPTCASGLSQPGCTSVARVFRVRQSVVVECCKLTKPRGSRPALSELVRLQDLLVYGAWARKATRQLSMGLSNVCLQLSLQGKEAVDSAKHRLSCGAHTLPRQWPFCQRSPGCTEPELAWRLMQMHLFKCKFGYDAVLSAGVRCSSFDKARPVSICHDHL